MNYLIEAFADTAFNANAEPFPCMSGPPAHIHLKPDAQPHARHSPIPIPLNWKDIIKDYLDDLVRRGIIKPVPIGMPVLWCALMVIIAKRNGKPRCTVDLQRLNAFVRHITANPRSLWHVKSPPTPRKPSSMRWMDTSLSHWTRKANCSRYS